jgi:hypothetical protein
VTPRPKRRSFAFVLLLAVAAANAAVEDRINEAMPLPKAAVFARTELFRLADDAGVLPQIQSDVATKLRVRALDCAQGYTPGAFTPEEEIAQHFAGSDCFQRRDDELVRWMGWRRVGILLRMPALRPIPSTVPPYLIAADYIQQLRFASNAGVVLLWTNRNLEVLDLANGRRIARVEGAGGDALGDLSPNGRVLPVSGPGGTSLMDVETGESLASVQSIDPADFAWMGPQRALIHRRSQIGSFIVDFDSGLESPVRISKEPIEKLVPSAVAPDQYLALTGLSAMRVRVGSGLGEAPLTLLDLKPFKIQNWMRNAGVLTSDGRNYVIAAQDLNLVSTSSLITTTVPVAPFEIRIVVPLPDPDLLLLSGENPGISPNTGWRQYVFSIARRTFTPLDRTDMKDGRIVYLTTVRKVGFITQNRVTLLDSLPVGTPISHGDFLTTMNLEQQHRAMAQPVPGPGVSGGAQRITMQAPGNNWNVSSPPGTVDIEGIGVVQSANAIARADGSREGLVLVHVKRSGGPLTLVLSSHEPVRWTLSLEYGATVTSIMTAGPKSSQVVGAGTIPVTHISDNDASQMGTPDYERLQAEVAQAAGARIRRFQSAAVGGEFTVDGR